MLIVFFCLTLHRNKNIILNMDKKNFLSDVEVSDILLCIQLAKSVNGVEEYLSNDLDTLTNRVLSLLPKF